MNSSVPDMTSRLTEFFDRHPREGLAVVYLFGSHAEGRPHRESDVDLGLVFRFDLLPTSRERFEAGARLISQLSGALGALTVDVVVLNDAPPGLAARVATGGRVVYSADESLEHSFRRDAQLRAADLEPFLRRTRRISWRRWAVDPVPGGTPG